MTLIQAVIAGLIQGLTEFLPVSSSGHLVIYNTLFGQDTGGSLSYTILLHLATLLAVCLLYRRDIWQLITELGGVLQDLFRGRRHFILARRRFLMLAGIASIPAVLAGLGVKLLGLDAYLENPYIVAVCFLITATLMFFLDRLPRGIHKENNAPLASAWIVGIMQAAAILPGLSRSGCTIFGGYLGRLEKEFAIRFAFVLSVPVILGATLLETVSFLSGRSVAIIWDLQQGAIMAGGFLTAFVTGMLSIRLIRLLLRQNRFYVFGYYCLLAAVVALYAGITRGGI